MSSSIEMGASQLVFSTNHDNHVESHHSLDITIASSRLPLSLSLSTCFKATFKIQWSMLCDRRVASPDSVIPLDIYASTQ